MPEVAEAVAVDTTPVDTAVDTTPDVAPDAVDTAPDQTVDETQPDQPTTETQADPDGRQMPAALRNHLAQLKTSNPALAKELKGLYFGAQAWKTEFPGGVQEAKALKQTFGEIGGAEGVKEIQGKVQEFSGLQEQFNSGSPAFVNDLAETNPQAFSKIAPAMLSKLSEVDGEGYQRMMSQVMTSTLKESGVSNALYLARQTLSMGNKEEAVKLLGHIEEWISGIGELAKKQPAQAQADPLANDRQALAEEKGRLFNEAAGREIDSFSKGAIKKELEQYTKGKPLDGERLEAIEERVIKIVSKSLQADPNFTATWQKYYNAGDRQGLVKFANSRFQALLPNAVKNAHKLFFSGASAPKTPPPPPGTPGTPPKPPAAGWTKVSGPPEPHKVDRAKTNTSMAYRSQAVLTDGRKVFWGANAPA